MTWVESETAPLATLLLGHGAGGDIGAPDLQRPVRSGGKGPQRLGGSAWERTLPSRFGRFALTAGSQLLK